MADLNDNVCLLFASSLSSICLTPSKRHFNLNFEVRVFSQINSAFNGNILAENLPAFPMRLPKILADHTDPEFLRERCETMNQYFVLLPKVPFVMQNPDFQFFLRPDQA
jgi:hypothetical protein